MRIVLSHPFSGALHWWLAAQSTASGDQRSKQPQHSYYKTLYGDVDRNLHIALACCVIFEDLVIPAADAPYPGFTSDADGVQHLADLELAADWNGVHEARTVLDPIERDLLADSVLSAELSTLPYGDRWMVVHYAIADILLTQMYSAPVISAPGRQRIVRRLLELGVVPVDAALWAAVTAAGGIVDELEAWADLACLRFNSRTVNQLADVKWNAKIREYGNGFQSALMHSTTTGTPLLELIASAWESAAVADQIAGVFTATSRTMGPAGLIPGVGTVTGIVGMTADAASVSYERRAERFRWFELGAEIQRYESLASLSAALRRQGLRD